MTAQAKLFNPNSNMPIGEKMEMLEKQLLRKCRAFHVSFGIFKTHKGPIDYNAMLVFTSNNGKHFNGSVNAENFSDLLSEMNDVLQSINDNS